MKINERSEYSYIGVADFCFIFIFRKSLKICSCLVLIFRGLAFDFILSSFHLLY